MGKDKRNEYKSRKKVNFIIYAAIMAVVLIFSLFSSLSQGGYLGFDFPRWSDFGKVFGHTDKIEESPVSIHFINVGNADCIFIKTQNGNVLIDAGDEDDESTIVHYLRKFEVKKLDYVIVTHPHSDHIGSMPKVLKSFDVGELIMPQMPEEIMPTTQIYKDLLTAIDENNIKMNYAKPERVLTLGEAALKIYTPLDEYDDINDMSIVTKLTYKNFSAVFTGDAGQSVESDMLKKYGSEEFKADVLKVGHHGSSTSCSEEFLKAVGARMYYIPCGNNNSYGHPSADTLERLKNEAKNTNGEIYRADWNGNVVVLSDGNEMSVINEDDE